jgi:hypothetical protein
MAQVPYPLTADSTQDLKVQVWELIRELYEEKIAGLSIGDVFGDDGDVLTLNLTSLSCLEKIGSGLSVNVKDDAGIYLSSAGLAIRCKSGGGVSVSEDGLELDTTVGLTSTLFDANTILKADSDNTPIALSVGTNRLVGRAAGTISALTAGDARTLLGLDTNDDVDFGALEVGDGSNYCDISSGGVITYVGTAKRTLTMRPSLVAGKQAGSGKPTPVAVGSHAGYSMPIYNTDDEELFFMEYVAGRWDGASNITVSVICCLAAAEDVGDKFKLQLSWENKAPTSGVISTSTIDVETETTVATGRAAQYSIYKVEFAIAYATPNPDVAAGDHIGFRLRRIDAADPDITGEVIVLDCLITYTVDKVFKA